MVAHVLGYPRIGKKRELKKAVEKYWRGETSKEELENTARTLRSENWNLQKEMGMTHIPSNDFSYYDQVLDMTCTLGAVPPRYEFTGESVDQDTYFDMARGGKGNRTAMEMTKWFDTNYHFIVPEFEKNQPFKLTSDKPVNEFNEAKDLGITTRPVLIGPLSYLLLGKNKYEGGDQLDHLNNLLPVYNELLNRLETAGAKWVQLDEPCLVTDLSDPIREAYKRAYATIREKNPNLKILMTTYFEGIDGEAPWVCKLPVDALHVDLVRAPNQLDPLLENWNGKMIYSLGVVNGRNIWKTNLEKVWTTLEKVQKKLGPENVWASASCSLLHSPYDLEFESELNPQVKSWMAFAKQKLWELNALNTALTRGGKESIKAELEEYNRIFTDRENADSTFVREVRVKTANRDPEWSSRKSPHTTRQKVQSELLKLPPFPTTTIGSFPQTKEVRQWRADYKAGRMDEKTYNNHLKEATASCIKEQEDLGLDVLVHGEFERNDMVEYFGEKLDGFIFSKFGWVQSYGSRCVKPPIIYGDVRRPNPMTVEWITYASTLTTKWVKGMLTGPVTILQWSFYRDDVPMEEVCRQIAWAIRDEVQDLEKAGIKIIQIDEAAFREGLPIKRAKWENYLNWAVESFKIASTGVDDSTQIHTHMCYSEFNDIIDSISKMDADVISIESSRSQMELLDALSKFNYPNQIGPGIYDIHSPRVPAKDDMTNLMGEALKYIGPDKLWINPDCGLKTRTWEEIRPSLQHMVETAHEMRRRL